MKKFLISSAGLLLIFSLAIPVSAKTFADVNTNQTFYEAIEFLASQGIVNGYPDGTYGPAIILNRAEMVKIIAEGSAKYYAWPADTFDAYSNKSCFTDVKANQWYTKYICYGKEKNWVVGYENGSKFKPDQKVTFVEGLKITYKGLDIEFHEDEETPWYRDLVNRASAKNYIPFNITGFNDGLRRDQMADLITRIIKYAQGPEEFDLYLGDRADIVVTYETLEKGLDLSKMEIEEKTPDDNANTNATYTVMMGAAGFSPDDLTVKSGDTVIFLNNDEKNNHIKPALTGTINVIGGEVL